MSPLHDDNPNSIKPLATITVIKVCVLGVYLLLYPRARAYVLVQPGFWIVLRATNSSVAIRREGGVACYAHIGGPIAGLALIASPGLSGPKNEPRRVAPRKWICRG
ncbi:MAG: hypothetical protein FD165_1470 [Gammaproteobacteria bacterium]|nr:MAG: hypothetical protein FD165_1470 [Gammaproteobacteria bacterium]TND03943.1 MAG: hypothetical protein FD120_1652 [Gammaproteobacteria bacterium]